MNGGVWRTDDLLTFSGDGPEWRPLLDKAPSLSIGAMAFDRLDPTHETIVVGVGAYSSYLRVSGPWVGLYHTTDAFESYRLIAMRGQSVSGVVARGDELVISVRVARPPLGSKAGCAKHGLFYSEDLGKTIVQTLAGVSYGIAEHPSDPDVLYTTISSFSVCPKYSTGIYRSADRGRTWQFVPFDNPMEEAAFSSILRVASNAAIKVASDGRVYLAVVDFGLPRVAYVSSADGITGWTPIDLPSTNEAGQDISLNPKGVKGPAAFDGMNVSAIVGGQGSLHFAMQVDPLDPNIVYFGGDRQPHPLPNSIGANDFSGRLFRCDVSRASGQQCVHLTHSNVIGAPGGGTASSSAPHADCRDMAFLADGQSLLEGDDGGVFLRTDAQSNQGDWFSVNGNVQITEAHDVAYDRRSKTVFTGNQDTGTSHQLLNGDFVSHFTGDGGDVACDPDYHPNFSARYGSFQGYQQPRVLFFDDDPSINEFTGFFLPRPCCSGFHFRTPVEHDCCQHGRYAVALTGFIVIYNNLFTEERRLSPGVASPFSAFYGEPIALGHPLNPELVVWSDGSAVYRFRGDSFGVEEVLGYEGDTVQEVVLDPSDASAIYVGDNAGKVWQHDGSRWNDITGGDEFGYSGYKLQDQGIHALAFVSRNGGAQRALVASRDTGVYYMRFVGVWARLGSGLPHALAYDLDYDQQDDVLICSMMGRSAWILRNVSDLIFA